QRKAAVGGGERVLVERLARRGPATVPAPAVPDRPACPDLDRDLVGRLRGARRWREGRGVADVRLVAGATAAERDGEGDRRDGVRKRRHRREHTRHGAPIAHATLRTPWSLTALSRIDRPVGAGPPLACRRPLRRHSTPAYTEETTWHPGSKRTPRRARPARPRCRRRAARATAAPSPGGGSARTWSRRSSASIRSS